MQHKNYLKSTIFFLMVILSMFPGNAQNINKLVSPDQRIEVNIDLQNNLQYSISFYHEVVIDNSQICLTLHNGTTLERFEITDIQESSVNETWERVWGKRKLVTNKYNELILHMKEVNSGILTDLYLRAFNDGVGIRYGFPEQDAFDSIILSRESTQFSFAEDHQVWRADYQNYISSQEQEFINGKLSDIKKDQLIGMPLLVKLDNKAYALITEANLTNWAGAFLRADTTKYTMVTDLAPYPEDTDIAVKRATPALSPWRVILIATEPAGLIESDLIANLNDPVAYDDVAWIKPGASAWDWWWSNKYAPAADFDLGPNQETMKYFIDFASEMGWQYHIVDWQWYGEPFGENGANPDADITTPIDGINIPELVKYAHSKHVNLIIWLHWEALKNQMDEALPLYEKWGVSGIKVDFMDRQDQEMVNFYHEVAKKAAEHHLVVDFHGAYKPTGVSRTLPNLITREGVMGNEYNKWSNRVTPEHNVTLPFTRGLLGEMDYTPGAFRNVTQKDFVTEDKTTDGSPMVQTTRCHQLAMAVVYESAFTVFCDSPDNYKTGTGLEFLKAIPTTWDDTKVLNAAVGDFIIIARKAGNKWYIGGMTDADERVLTFDLAFLEKGKYQATLFEDADQANEFPSEINKEEKVLTNTDRLSIRLAKGGGFVAVLEPVEKN
ncbi:MAG: glycoside hydrolase family 97 protein [Bacteroidales bacterium]|nr:glycoside hydrolase family 97 protein [Bacteroidales bacterium]